MSPEEKTAFLNQIVCAVKEVTPASTLTEDEQRWVRMAIRREAQTAEFRKSIIEKTFTGVVWSGIVWVGVVFLEYAKTHGFK